MDDDLRRFAREVIEAEAAAVAAMAAAVGDGFGRAVRLLVDCPGAAVVTGIGKAGHVARKVSATLASTGTPSHFLSPADALHGDLGSVRDGDVLVAFSASGESEEIVRILSVIKGLGNRVVAVTASEETSLGRHGDAVIPIGQVGEACALGLAPSCSTTAMLAVGDALALTISRAKKFTADDFARFHPAGALGRRLLKVGECMTFRLGENLPTADAGQTVAEALAAVSAIRRRPGAICVLGEGEELLGVFSDGDLRRLLTDRPAALHGPIGEVMTATPKTVGEDDLAAEALATMRRHRIDELPVLAEGGRCVGLIDVQDLMLLRLG